MSKTTQITCDICGQDCQFKKGYANFVFTDMAMGIDQILKPVVRNEDYCEVCSEELKKALNTIKLCQDPKN